jgi:Protein of unknown function (DUF3300)
MGARSIRVVTGIFAIAFLLVSPPVRAQTAPAPAVETRTPPAAGLPMQAPQAETLTAEDPALHPPATPPGQGGETPGVEAPPAPPFVIPDLLRAEQLDQLLAPIALYPDALLAQILVAATYPLEIVKANRWLQDPRQAALSGDQLAAALAAEAWDPSIKALVTVPQILTVMDANLDWTQELGDAFVAQQADVMDAIQRLRYQAAAAGNLWSNAQQRVTEEGQGISIEPVNPAYIYTPLYNPALVYGPWPSPEYPPLDIVPPDYGVGFGLPLGIAFGPGFVVVQRIWPRCTFDWVQRRIRRDTQTSKAFDHTVPRPELAIWRHDPVRQGVASPDLGSRARFVMFRDHHLSVAAVPQIAAPRVASGPRVVLPHAAPRAFSAARMGSVARIQPERGVVGRPIIMQHNTPRPPAAWPILRSVAASKVASQGGGPHFEGASHR